MPTFPPVPEGAQTLAFVHEYTPRGPISTANTLGSFLPGGLEHPGLKAQGMTIGEFQAEKLLEAGYRIVYVGENT